ncbi:MAG: SagB/ThcOx family dehydrogenase [Planctomycetes bacterium]|nr:SagB/ThcOx family dehydrogenase [Planctomycetota bacterium]
MDTSAIVLHYHETTKHYPHRYARSLGYMDWATQPDPFRRYRGAPCVPLLLVEPAVAPPYDALYEPGAIAPRSLSLETISEFFQYSLALSAWKEIQGSRWALRINPSSGNLHPTEGYLAMGTVQGLTTAPGVFHYAPKDHVLERRCEVDPEVWDCLIHGYPTGTFLVGLSSIHWREVWKYGERAFRYCQHDVGHALAALCLSAALQGWQVRPLTKTSDEELGALLGLDRDQDFENAEREHPDLLVAVIPSAESRTGKASLGVPSDALGSVVRGKWFGSANRLSSDHVDWALIDSIASACVKPSTPELAISAPANDFPAPLNPLRSVRPARAIIHQRRSAVAMDGRTRITADQFYLMMDRVLPRFQHAPWCALGPPAHVHLGLFVHLVNGLEPGMYFLVRSPGQLATLRESTRAEFTWQKPDGCPKTLPLYHLISGDVRTTSGRVSCGQDIAAEGAFSLGMIVDFQGPLQTYGPWIYRRLFWETGVIGQILYLEAEAAGIRSTGIGCFFDDPVHDLFGFKDGTYQSLYHFTVGGPVEDTRLTTLPPYPSDITMRAIATGCSRHWQAAVTTIKDSEAAEERSGGGRQEEAPLIAPAY